jgi:5'-nucleotidase
MGIDNLLSGKPDIVISGINRGANMGMVTFYSATVACAREAAFQRIPAISVSLESGPDMDYNTAAAFIASLIKDVIKLGLRGGTYLNVNIPALPKEKINGVLIVPLDSRAPLESYVKESSSDNEQVFLPTFAALPAGDVKTDVWAVKNGYIAISPISIDKTSEEEIRALQSLEALWKCTDREKERP